MFVSPASPDHVNAAAGRLGGLDAIVTPIEQREWLASAPAESAGRDVRPDRQRQRVAGRVRFGRLAADPRFEALLPAVRRYLAWTMPFPRRTEFSRWSISARPDTGKNSWPRMFTVTVHSLETLYAFAPVGEEHRTLFALNVDLATMEQRWGGGLEDLAGEFGAAYHVEAGYRVRPGVLRLTVDGARNLMRLLDVDGVVDAARRLNLDMMRMGPALQWRGHSFDFADRLLEPVREPAGAAFDLGLACDAQGDIPRAEAFYHRAALAGDPEAAFRLGELWTERGDGDQAEPWYRTAGAAGYEGVRRSPDFAGASALAAWGREYEQRGDLENAATCYRRAAEGGDTETYLALGGVLGQQGDLVRAAIAYRCAADAGHATGWFHLGLLEHDRGEVDRAESCYRRAADAGHPAAQVEVGFLHERRGETASAESCYRRAVAAGDVDGLVHLGDLLLRRGETDGAEACYRRAIRRGSATGLIGLGIVHETDGDLTNAEACYRRAVDLGRTRGLINLGYLYAQQDDDERAEACYRDAVAAGHTDAHLYFGDLRHFQGDHDAAERHYRLAAAADHDEAVTRLGGLFLDLGDLDAAEPLLRVAAAADPVAMYWLGLLLDRRGQAAEAERWRRQAADALTAVRDLGVPAAVG